jgi:hypothetical protein
VSHSFLPENIFEKRKARLSAGLISFAVQADPSCSCAAAKQDRYSITIVRAGKKGRRTVAKRFSGLEVDGYEFRQIAMFGSAFDHDHDP